MKEDIQETLEKRHGYSTEEKKTEAPHGVKANLTVNKRDGETGTLKKSEQVKNIIPNDGANYVRDTVGSAPASNAMSVVQVGTGGNAGAFTSTSTALHTHNANSGAAYGTKSNQGEFSRTTTFTNISTTIDESGLFNGDGDAATALAMQTFGDITLTTNDSLEVVWKVFFSDTA